MSYGYSLRLVQLNREADNSNLGVKLGRLCIEHDIPVAEVAKRCNVSRVTVYSWFCGNTVPQTSKLPFIKKFIETITA
jgi:transcriptional regulator with XRE-family HTH domain